MRRKIIPQQHQYIRNRISQLKEDMDKAHDDYDKMWYNRLIQELNWANQMNGKPSHNCYMAGEDA